MSNNTVLYRKYRPMSFDEVIGQDHIVSLLKASIKQENPAHAYLFSGGRGLGKTSIARIFAKELGTVAEDIMEIDAASNRGIDDVRELREGVSVLPFRSAYKVYIIDEVHMLTKEAFNALLKTLEEPPAHAIFILATTELDKVPDTIISRCQSLVLKKPNKVVLSNLIADVAKKEKVKISNEGAELIALLGDGSFRDALGILHTVITVSGDKTLSISEIELVTGAPPHQLIKDFVLAYIHRDIDKALSVLSKVPQDRSGFVVFIERVIDTIRRALLIKHAPSMREGLESDMNDDDKALATDIAKSVTIADLGTLIATYGQALTNPLPVAVLEVATIERIAKDQ